MAGFYGNAGPSTLQRVDLSMAIEKIDVQAQKEGLVAMEICPPVTVGQQNGKFPVVNEEMINQRLVDDQRTFEKKFNRMRMFFHTDTYTTQFYGTEIVLDRQERAIYEDDFEQDRMAAETQELNSLKNLEKRVLALALTAPSAATTISTEWTDPTSKPVTDMIKILVELRNKRRTFTQNKLRLVLDWEVANLLRLNTEIKDCLSTTMRKLPDDISNDLLARALGVGKVCIANSFENMSAEGTATADVDYDLQWDRTKAFLCIAESSKKQGFRWANTLQWTKGIAGWEQYHEPQTDGDVLRYRKAYGLKIIDSASALQIADVAA